MDKEELREEFEKNIRYIEKNIPPDDIYAFAEETLMAACYFLLELGKEIEISARCKDDPVFRKWVHNICEFKYYQSLQIDVSIDLDLKSLD